MRRLLLAALLAAGCGTGTDGKPVAPTAPAPEPAPPPTVRAKATVTSRTEPGRAYYAGDSVILLIEFIGQPLGVRDSPRLAIEVGGHVRLADFLPWDDWPPERPSWRQRFKYEVGPDDEDLDGITIQTDAFDFSEGALLTAAGVAVEIEFYAVAPHLGAPDPAEPGVRLEAHRVIGQPEPRVCTDERAHALAYGAVLVEEWDGTPFGVYFDETIPASERADAEYTLEIVERLSERLEAQLGYSVVEAAGWIGEEERGFAIEGDLVVRCEGLRPGGIVATVTTEDFGNAHALPWCGVISWANGEIRTERGDFVMPHELFHLFGFTHSRSPELDDPYARPPGVGVAMSVPLTVGIPGTGTGLGVTFDDIDALRCIFLEGG